MRQPYDTSHRVVHDMVPALARQLHYDLREERFGGDAHAAEVYVRAVLGDEDEMRRMWQWAHERECDLRLHDIDQTFRSKKADYDKAIEAGKHPKITLAMLEQRRYEDEQGVNNMAPMREVVEAIGSKNLREALTTNLVMAYLRCRGDE